VTTLSSSLPRDRPWNVPAMCAASVGDVIPGRNATMYFSRSVSLVSAAVTSHASSHQTPVGVSTP
jgi:hypothetical protein